MSRGEPARPRLPVAVVGGGVSGCAAAAALADEGVPVVLLTAALDVLGMPGYGPTLDQSGGRRALEGLPAWFRPAWSDGALCVADERGPMVVDRRLVSLDAIWLLESHPLIQVRQGLATAVRPSVGIMGTDGADLGVEVETVFGEILRARAAILAVGTALGGRLRVDDHEVPAGRLGEVPADVLRDQLAAAGVRLIRRETAVGARVVPTASLQRIATQLQGEVTALTPCAGASNGPEGALVSPRPAGLPPLPEEDASPPAQAVVLSVADSTSEGDAPAGLWPDGRVTGEWYVSPGVDLMRLKGLVRVTRPAHIVAADVLDSAGHHGAVEGLPGVWVIGTAAGETGHADALRSAVRVARAVRDSLAAADGRPAGAGPAGPGLLPFLGDESHE